MAEGSPGAYEIEEPDTLGRTGVFAAIGAVGGMPSSETGLIPAVELKNAEGKDDGEAQDASLTTDETQQPTPKKAAKTETAKAPQVMIVEDTIELAEVIQATLERMDMVTFHASHGNQAIEKLGEFNPDVVLLDISLPDMTGWKILDEIKEKYTDDAKTKSPVVIVITAYGDPANRLVGKLQGIHSYLIKPFTSDEIEKVVTQALESPTS